MTRHILIFVATFIAGSLIALAARTASHRPHADETAAASASTADAHASHHAAVAPEPAAATKPAAPNAGGTASAADKPVNTVCAICGMDVDPKLPTLEYKGKRIGFGCRMCPPKFKADPDKYGPYYLRNEVIKR